MVFERWLPMLLSKFDAKMRSPRKKKEAMDNLTKEMLVALHEVRLGNAGHRKMMDALVVRSLLVCTGGRYDISWVGRIALDAYALGHGARAVAA